MISSDTFLGALELVNETLTATIVIVSVSILLYNLSQHTQDDVARASAIVLLCVTLTYLGDVFASLDPGERYLELWLRSQWIGIAFVPAALYHLSDALLATTGRPSRGRRKTIVAVAYVVSTMFSLLAMTTNTIVTGPESDGIARMAPAPGFAVYVVYLFSMTLNAVINVFRARRRCLTRSTRRRMTYLLSVFLSPVYGVFPYSLLYGPLTSSDKTTLLLVLNLANLIVMFMIIFMAYPLSFFGLEKPDRVIKSQLLEFMLRGPLTGAAVLVVILFVPRITSVLGFNGDDFMPFAAVTMVLFLQWALTLSLPILKRWLIYTHDQKHAQWLQGLSERLLTEADTSQLLESILAALCDCLRVPTAFVAEIEDDTAQLVQVVGSLSPSPAALTAPELSTLVQNNHTANTDETHPLQQVGELFVWHSYWLVPLRYSQTQNNGPSNILGVLGVWARAGDPDLTPEEADTLHSLAKQAARILEDLQRQSAAFVILEGLTAQLDVIQQRSGVSRYGRVFEIPPPSDDVITNPDFSELVKNALRNYWGGPKLTQSELLRLHIVWQEMKQADDENPVRALRNVLAQAIENLKPEGQRSLTTTEWILYNILEMRFLQGRKVRDVALRLAMSESDLYRKQRIAIEEVANQIAEMERNAVQEQSDQSSAPPDIRQTNQTANTDERVPLV